MPEPKKRVVYAITERDTPEGRKTFWTKVGTAFENRDGSITIQMEALPLSGKIQVRDAEERPVKGA